MGRRDRLLSRLSQKALLQLHEKGVDVSGYLHVSGATTGATTGAMPRETRPNKFGVNPSEQRTCDGIVFDSTYEMRVYQVLKEYDLEFQRQVPFELQPGFVWDGGKVRPIAYYADFVLQAPDGSELVVDAKGKETYEFRLKRKMFIYRHRKELHLIKNMTQLRIFLAENGFKLRLLSEKMK